MNTFRSLINAFFEQNEKGYPEIPLLLINKMNLVISMHPVEPDMVYHFRHYPSSEFDHQVQGT